MNTRSHVVALAAVFALTNVVVIASAQQRSRSRQRLSIGSRAENDGLTVRRDPGRSGACVERCLGLVPPRSTAVERSDGPYHRLTGTFHLERSRGEDPARAVDQATRALAVRAAARGRAAPRDR